MKRNKRRLPLPQHEFGFTPDTFNLFAEVSLDGERITREQAEAEQSTPRGGGSAGRVFHHQRNFAMTDLHKTIRRRSRDRSRTIASALSFHLNPET